MVIKKFNKEDYNKVIQFLRDNYKENKSMLSWLPQRFDDLIFFNGLTKEQVLTYLKDKIKDETLDYEQMLVDTSFEKYGFRYINKIINKYKQKINS